MVAHRAPGRRVDRIGPHLEEGLQHKGAEVQRRMRDDQSVVVHAEALEHEQIEVEGAIAPVAAPSATRAVLELAADVEQIVGREATGEQRDPVEEPPAR